MTPLDIETPIIAVEAPIIAVQINEIEPACQTWLAFNTTEENSKSNTLPKDSE